MHVGEILGYALTFVSTAICFIGFVFFFLVLPAFAELGTGDPKKKLAEKRASRKATGDKSPGRKLVWLAVGIGAILLGGLTAFFMNFWVAKESKTTSFIRRDQARGDQLTDSLKSLPSLPVVQVHPGDLKHHGGTATVRKSFVPQVDNPLTTNNEANDQPLGHFGTVTLNVYNVSSGNSYPLDADVEDGQVKRLYFEKGGWVDFDGADIDAEGNGEGTDETGHEWRFEGFAN